MCAWLAGLMTAWVWTTQWAGIGKDLVTLSEQKVHPQDETPKLDVHSCSPPEHEIWDRRRHVQRKRRPWWCKIFYWLENSICTLFGLENTLGKCTYLLEEQICYDFEDTHERMRATFEW